MSEPNTRRCVKFALEQRREPEYPRCYCTKDELKAAHLNVLDDCPACLDFGVRCPVGFHPLILPSAASVGAVFDLQKVLADAVSTLDDDIVRNERDLYLRVAECLVTEPAAIAIAHTIREYAQQTVEDDVFIVVEAPSGSGKSQLPFVMEKMGIATIHVVLEMFDRKSRVQEIYCTLNAQSQCLLEALRFDMNKWPVDSYDDDNLSRQKLLDDEERAVVRVITYLLGDPAAIVGTGQFTTEALREYVVAQHRAGITLPVFFLDEVMALNDSELRYLRNVFRVVGLLVVLMGTGSTAANFVGSRNVRTRGSESSSKWCHVVTRLPRSTEASLSALGWTRDCQDSLSTRWPALVQAVNACHSTSNPFFLRVMIETLLAAASVSGDRNTSSSSFESSSFAADFDGILQTAMDRIYTAKPALTTQEGLAAQLCLHSDLYRPQEVVASVGKDPLRCFTHVDATVLVSHHFAIPTRSNYSLYLDPSTQLHLVDGTIWMNEPALFVRCEEDPWLYLILGGGKYPQMEPWHLIAARQTVRTYTTNTALTAVRSLSLAPGTDEVESSQVMARSGDNLALLAVLATIVASRCNGVRGATWWDFVRHLTTHLACDLSTPLCDMQWSWDLSKRSAPMEALVGRWVVPFLGPLNSSWPEEFKTMPEVRFGEVERAALNKDRVDFKVKGSPDTLSFTGECQNYRGPVGIEAMKSILDRVPPDTQFHSVVVSRLHKKYSLTRASRGEAFATTNVVKVVVHRQGRTLSLAPAWPAMDLVPWDACTRLVLFVEEDSLNPPATPTTQQGRGASSSGRYLSAGPKPKKARASDW